MGLVPVTWWCRDKSPCVCQRCVWQGGGGIKVDVKSGRESTNKFVERLEANFEITWPSIGKVGLCFSLENHSLIDKKCSLVCCVYCNTWFTGWHLIHRKDILVWVKMRVCRFEVVKLSSNFFFHNHRRLIYCSYSIYSSPTPSDTIPGSLCSSCHGNRES